MKMQLTLCDLTLDAIIKQLRQVLEAPFFSYDGKKFSAGKVEPHHSKDSLIIRNEKRPLILFSFNGSSAICFYEGDTFISDGTGKMTIRGKKEMSFSITTVTAEEAERIEAKARLNKSFSDSYWKDLKADMEREMKEERLSMGMMGYYDSAYTYDEF